MATLNYERHIPKHFGVCSSGFSLLPARFEAIMRIAARWVNSLAYAATVCFHAAIYEYIRFDMRRAFVQCGHLLL